MKRKTIKSLLVIVMAISIISSVGCSGGSSVKTTPTPEITPTPTIATTKTPSPEPTDTPTPRPTLDISDLGDEVYLTDLEYTDYYLNGDDEPFYGYIPHNDEYLEVNGIRFTEGVFINPVFGDIDGYVTYDISEFPFKRFVAKVGKLDVHHGSGDPLIFRVYFDDELAIESDEMSQFDDAFLIDIAIPDGAKELMLECNVVTNNHTRCSGVFGDARLCYADKEIVWPE